MNVTTDFFFRNCTKCLFLLSVSSEEIKHEILSHYALSVSCSTAAADVPILKAVNYPPIAAVAP